MSRPDSAALPIAHTVLRVLIVLNWLSAAAILVLIVAMPSSEWIMKAFDISAASPDAGRLITGLHIIALIGLATIPVNHLVLTRLLAMVQAVREGTPFVAANASRLLTIAWALLALQLLGLVIGGIARLISTAEHIVDIDAGFSINGWLAVLLTFVLARVFAAGARMREDLEGTI